MHSSKRSKEVSILHKDQTSKRSPQVQRLLKEKVIDRLEELKRLEQAFCDKLVIAREAYQKFSALQNLLSDPFLFVVNQSPHDFNRNKKDEYIKHLLKKKVDQQEAEKIVELWVQESNYIKADAQLREAYNQWYSEYTIASIEVKNKKTVYPTFSGLDYLVKQGINVSEEDFKKGLLKVLESQRKENLVPKIYTAQELELEELKVLEQTFYDKLDFARYVNKKFPDFDINRKQSYLTDLTFGYDEQTDIDLFKKAEEIVESAPKADSMLIEAYKKWNEKFKAISSKNDRFSADLHNNPEVDFNNFITAQEKKKQAKELQERESKAKERERQAYVVLEYLKVSEKTCYENLIAAREAHQKYNDIQNTLTTSLKKYASEKFPKDFDKKSKDDHIMDISEYVFACEPNLSAAAVEKKCLNIFNVWTQKFNYLKADGEFKEAYKQWNYKFKALSRLINNDEGANIFPSKNDLSKLVTGKEINYATMFSGLFENTEKGIKPIQHRMSAEDFLTTLQSERKTLEDNLYKVDPTLDPIMQKYTELFLMSKAYTDEIEKHKTKNGDIDFAHGFFIGAKQRAKKREANYKMAKLKQEEIDNSFRSGNFVSTATLFSGVVSHGFKSRFDKIIKAANEEPTARRR